MECAFTTDRHGCILLFSISHRASNPRVGAIDANVDVRRVPAVDRVKVVRTRGGHAPWVQARAWRRNHQAATRILPSSSRGDGHQSTYSRKIDGRPPCPTGNAIGTDGRGDIVGTIAMPGKASFFITACRTRETKRVVSPARVLQHVQHGPQVGIKELIEQSRDGISSTYGKSASRLRRSSFRRRPRVRPL